MPPTYCRRALGKVFTSSLRECVLAPPNSSESRPKLLLSVVPVNIIDQRHFGRRVDHSVRTGTNDGPRLEKVGQLAAGLDLYSGSPL